MKPRIVVPLLIVIGLISGSLVSVIVEEVYVGEASFKIGDLSIYPVERLKRTYKDAGYLIETRTRYVSVRPIEVREEVEEGLVATYQVRAAKNGQLELPYLYDVDDRPGEIIRIRARGRTPEETREFLQEVLQSVLSRHERIYETHMAIIQQQLEVLSGQASFGEHHLPLIVLNLLDAFETRDLLIDTDDIPVVAENLLAVYQEYSEAIMPMNAGPTRILREPIVFDKKLKPNAPLYVLTGGFFGGIFAIILIACIRIDFGQIISDLKIPIRQPRR